MQSAYQYFYPEGNTTAFVPTLTAVSEGSEISSGSEQSAMNVLASYSESGEYESILDSSDLVPLWALPALPFLLLKEALMLLTP